MENLFAPDPWIRLPLYVVLGIVTEVIFTGVWDLINPNYLHSWIHKNLDGHKPNPVRRDPRAMGYTFLWMIPIYMLLLGFEPISAALADLAWPLRGIIYLAIFYLGEYSTGALIKKITGYNPWDYSYSRYSLHGHIRWDFAPYWFGFCLFVEYLSQKFILLTPAIKAAFLS